MAEGHNPSTHDVYKESPPYMLKEKQQSTNSEKLENWEIMLHSPTKKRFDGCLRGMPKGHQAQNQI
jgi:hypothetical protein